MNQNPAVAHMDYGIADTDIEDDIDDADIEDDAASQASTSPMPGRRLSARISRMRAIRARYIQYVQYTIYNMYVCMYVHTYVHTYICTTIRKYTLVRLASSRPVQFTRAGPAGVIAAGPYDQPLGPTGVLAAGPVSR